MASNDQFDPKFTPVANLLKVVDLKVGQLASANDIYSLLEGNYASSRKLDYQNSVLFYTLYRRGEDLNAIAARFGETPETIRRRANEGMAILRTGETTRTVAAVRKASLGMKAIDEATLDTTDPNKMIVALEELALLDGLRSYQIVGNKGSNAATAVATAPLYTDILQHLQDKAIPMTAPNIIAAIPVFAEELNIERKQRKAATGTTGHLGLEAGLKKVMDDVTEIVKACDGEPYVPTDEDLITILQFVDWLGRLMQLEPGQNVFQYMNDLVAQSHA